MRYVIKPVIRRVKSSEVEYWPEGDCAGHTIHEQEKGGFTGLYDHEGNEVHKVSDFKMGFI